MNKIFYLTGVCGLAVTGVSFAQKPYNIVFIMSDDHGVGAISAYGKSLIPTPNIDRIAAKGLRFNNSYCVVSLSSPSRASIITGKYNELNGLWYNETDFDGSQQTFPKLMQQAGYETAIFGKWHLGSAPTGFDYYKVLDGHGQYYDCPLYEKGRPWTDDPKGGDIHKGYLTDVITDESIGWLERRDKTKPFMLMVHHKAPHNPYDYPDRYRSVFQNEDLPEPPNFWDDHQGRNSHMRDERCTYTKLRHIGAFEVRDTVPEGMKTGTDAYQQWMYQTLFKGYYRLIAALDENIGRLLDYLEKTGLDRNTIIIYTSDNGFFMGDHGFYNKMWMYEESLHVPLIVYHPAMEKGGRASNRLVSTLDYASTFLDVAGAPIPSDLQGMSFLPLLEGKKTANWRKEHYYRYVSQWDVPEHYGIRTDRYKLIYFPDSKDIKWELYDMKKDPHEMRNIAAEPANRKIMHDLQQRMYHARLTFEHNSKK